MTGNKSRRVSNATIAKWLFDKVKAERQMDQSEAALGIRKDFGDKYLDYDGGWGVIKKPILRAFAELSGSKVVWSRSNRHWRLRQPDDAPGRTQP